MRRMVVTARLRRGGARRVREILREGPPFDLAATSLERHQVFLDGDSVVFVFEGPHADREIHRLLDDFAVIGRASRIARWTKGRPSIPDEIFSWERPVEMDLVSYGPLPGAGDSDGG